jgi:hypothetical protein
MSQLCDVQVEIREMPFQLGCSPVRSICVIADIYIYIYIYGLLVSPVPNADLIVEG